METPAKPKQSSKRRRNLFIYLLGFGLFALLFAFSFYKFLVGQAFADRGVVENVVPTLYSPRNEEKDQLLDSVNERFKCRNQHLIDISHINSIGMFPYLLKNNQNTCNRAADFVGYDGFLDAMLHGEKHLGIPAKSSKSASYDHHHPGLEILKKLLDKNEKFDPAVEFYWWMFPIPMGIPNRGFSYAIFQGDYENLKKAAQERDLHFQTIYLDGIKIFLALQGWDTDRAQPLKSSKFSYDERDHIVTKVWISLKCFIEYEGTNENQRYLQYKSSLESFMRRNLIRYPADFICIQE